jgi:3-hydroxybutyryl-CoA dehydrogenase
MTNHDLPGTVIVIGAGRMGAGIAHAFLVRGCTVQVRDAQPEGLEKGLQAIQRSVRKSAQLDTSLQEEALLDRLTAELGLTDLPEADLVIEAVPELPDVKKEVLRAVADAVPTSTVIASNTSSISIAELATAASRPERMLGMHFFNPVPVSRLVELVRGPDTADQVVEAVQRWTTGIGKTSITVRDSPGFATSRLGVATGLEAIRMLEEGVASAADIDTGMELGYGYPIGPLRLTDIVGLEVRLEIAEYCGRHYGARFDAPQLLRDLVERGDLGRKSGAGFYDWSDPERPVPRAFH